MLISAFYEVVWGLWMLLLVVTIHELGHFTAAHFLKMPISSMEVGIGPKVFSFGWRGVQFRWYALPICGELCLCWYSKYQWKNIVFFLAGSVFNFALALLAYTLLSSEPLGHGSLAAGLLNLIPFRTKRLDSDGYQVLYSLRHW